MKKQGWILIAITGAFFCLLIGVFLGRNTNRSYIRIDSNQTPTAQTIHSKPTTAPTAPTHPLTSKPTVTRPTEALGVININTATAEQLQFLPGIGDALSQRIIDYRNQNGNFKAIDEIKNVSGIGEKKFANIKDYITVG